MSVATMNGEVTEDVAVVSINRLAAETLLIPLIGTTPLIVNRFSEKAKRAMLDNAQGRKTPKAPKDPEAEYQAAFYRFEDGRFGFPTGAFKQATVGGARFYNKNAISMTALRQFFFPHGEVSTDGNMITEIVGEPRMREDYVTVGRGGDLRYRPEFTEWSAVWRVTLVMSSLDRGSLFALIDAGGLGVGVGEWRPEKNGNFGTYRIDLDKEIEVVR